MKVLLIDQIATVNYKYSYSLAKALAEDGIDLCMVIDQKNEDEGCDVTKYRWFNTGTKGIGKIAKLINYIQSYCKICKEVETIKFDVLHTQWVIFSPLDYWFLKRIKEKSKARFIITIHDILPFNQKFYDYHYHKKIYSMADGIIVQAENNVARFRELFPEYKKLIKMIPHGHFFDYVEIVDKEKARERLRIDQNKFVFLFFGQIKKVKGIAVLIEAFSKVVKREPNALLVIAGNVWKDDFTQYKTQIERYNLEDSIITDIRYIPDEDVKYYYAASDVCVLPYLNVYQSGVIQLVYAHERMAIASDLAPFKEVVKDKETALLFKTNDAEDLSRTMLTAINMSIDERRRMALNGGSHIKGKYDWKAIANDVLAAYGLR